LLRLLRPLYPLRDKRILEVGCGNGRVLNEFLGYGAHPRRLHGVDLLEHRVHSARATMPHLPLICADGQHLPYADASFDLVLQYTAFSSILDEAIKAQVAREMLRLARRPNGLIIWYDFWLNPSNPDTRGIRPDEIRALFPGCAYQFRRITLAPPISRKLVSISWLLCYLLDGLKVFNTHYLVAIKPL
jgi:SAM-dependent methyltransferase